MNDQKLTAADVPEMSVFQKLMLEEIKKKPDVMQLFKVIFDDYPKVFVSEYSCMHGATKKRRDKGIELGSLRIKMEAFIEDKIARLAGIDVDGFIAKQKESEPKTDVPTTEQIQNALGVANTSQVIQLPQEEASKELSEDLKDTEIITPTNITETTLKTEN